MSRAMVAHAPCQAWLVAVGWGGDVRVMTGDLPGQEAGNGARQKSQPPYER